MTITLVFILSILHLSNCGDYEKGIRQDTLLDISNPDSSKVDIHEGLDSGISYKNYSVKDGQSIVTIVDGAVLLWKGGKDENVKSVVIHYSKDGSTELLAMVVHRDGSASSICYTKVGSVWNEIGDDAFDDALEEIKRATKQSHASPDVESKGVESEDLKGGKMVEGPSTRGVAKDNGHYKHLRGSLGNSQHVRVTNESGPERRIGYTDSFQSLGSLVRSSHYSFRYPFMGTMLSPKTILAHSGHHSPRSSSRQSPVTMDVADPDWRFFEVDGKKEGNGSYSGMVSPLDNFYIKTVVYGKETLWKKHGGWECTHVSIYTSRTRELLTMGFKRRMRMEWRAILRYNGGKWQDVTRLNACDIIFDMKRESMKEIEKSNGLLDQVLKSLSVLRQWRDKRELKKPYKLEELMAFRNPEGRVRRFLSSNAVSLATDGILNKWNGMLHYLRGKGRVEDRARNGYNQVMESTMRILRGFLRR